MASERNALLVSTGISLVRGTIAVAWRGDLRRRLDALPYGIWLIFELHVRAPSPVETP